jgi:anti-sigma factor RsiW
VPEPAPSACAACRELLGALLDGSLPEPGRRRAVAHLSRCADCRAALAALEPTASAPAAEPLDPRTREELLELFRSWRAGRQGD